ncbi:hypothetical protein GC105_16630 [Alkalibaculum sp. M08DMB]|uniref:Transposase IS200-like domain-containing protein n=1 Tax=Alkalibaculum sporogenes TaxID=2655001 RepID=A0A6A7KCW9_9FIRM|nr:transposase [Alkalibaculum sporogenes]MPW27379.1 hypothetical protein [Alkalibaculum sporogenes]
MVRQARKESPTGYYHIMMRGNNREEIFRLPEQKKYFLKLLLEQTEEQIEIAAYCMMDNHVHIVVYAPIKILSEGLKKLNIKYAMKYNYLNDRVGHVFQDRYKSEIIHDEIYLNQVIRYVHNNPVKARMVEFIDEYQWSSYHEYTDKIRLVSKAQKEFIMDLFSKDLELFIKFHEEIDYFEYIDTKEEIQRNRITHAQEIIEQYCDAKGITEEKQIKNNPHFLQEMIFELLYKTKLSHREIARLLEVSSNLIHKLNIEGK